MGIVHRKTITKPLPKSAKTITRKGEQLANWLDNPDGRIEGKL